MLLSPMRGFSAPWEPLKRTEAGCSYIYARTHSSKDDGDAPQFSCSCGLYGYRSLDDQIHEINELQRFRCVFGLVSLWGRTIEHEKGYRSQYGYVYSLFNVDTKLTPETSIDLKAISNRYGVDILPAPSKLLEALKRPVPKAVAHKMTPRQNCFCAFCMSLRLNKKEVLNG